jgi:hypothetical protein
MAYQYSLAHLTVLGFAPLNWRAVITGARSDENQSTP